MQFRPCLHHALLPPGQAARNQLDRINATDDNCILIIGVEMRRVMLDASLQIHPDDNPEKAAQFRHGESLLQLPASFKHYLHILDLTSKPPGTIEWE